MIVNRGNGQIGHARDYRAEGQAIIDLANRAARVVGDHWNLGRRIGRGVVNFVDRIAPRQNWRDVRELRPRYTVENGVAALRTYPRNSGPRSFVKSNPQQSRGPRGRSAGPRRRGGGARRRVARRPMRTGGRRITFGLGYRKPELKNFDTTTSAGPLSNNFQVYAVPCVISQGALANNRVGRKIFAKSILITGTIAMTPVSAATDTDTVFVYVILDRQSNGVTANIADIWSDTVTGRCLRNLDQGPRFKILKTLEVKLQAPLSSGYVQNESFELFVPINKTMTYATGATSPSTNNVLVYVGAIVGTAVTMVTNQRLRFYDN